MLVHKPCPNSTHSLCGRAIQTPPLCAGRAVAAAMTSHWICNVIIGQTFMAAVGIYGLAGGCLQYLGVLCRGWLTSHCLPLTLKPLNNPYSSPSPIVLCALALPSDELWMSIQNVQTKGTIDHDILT